MIVFDQVTKRFGENTFALQNVSFAISPGEFVFLTGPSGSGKTTIMRILTKEYMPTEGEVQFLDTQLSTLKPNQVFRHRRQIGVIFQDYKLLPELNVWENIALPLYIVNKSQDEIESRVTDLLKLVGLEEKAFLFPSQLSGGEAQRVSIARALATGPQVIFADEPTGNLDPETSIAIAKLLHKINSLGTTVLLATHDTGVLGALTQARRLKLEKGKLIEDTHPNQASTHLGNQQPDTHDSEPPHATPKKEKPVQVDKKKHPKEPEPRTTDPKPVSSEKTTTPKKSWRFSFFKKSDTQPETEEQKKLTIEVENLNED